jgi:Protein of unknown function (DUF2721)
VLLLIGYPVGNRIGNVRNNDQALLDSIVSAAVATSMFGVENKGSALDTIAHIIQVALTPIFLVSGIATLLNVLSTGLSRVADRVEAVSKELEGADEDDRKNLVGPVEGSASAIDRA